ncbi:hypothetical protein Z517_11029 [Fonsecaea pedrosoi CBS 271.37]|uniref:Uncharacterized protein n=1 Tax=Fonsecaea pedrosoi CBS 271.37 TaxID=1442368 RepID=A0A0D2G6K2_9EURO|nr:uncharacterized protein Z517_11029 [Fonsecaea pedrosoi CBS 271.37]KIW76283.1 hypothetical protein Z517_11029 [Fonsecaea pedrosoi CBS 271.37]
MELFIAVKAVKSNTGKFTERRYTLTIPDAAAESAMQVKAQIVLQPSSIVVRIMMDNIAVPDSVVLQTVYVVSPANSAAKGANQLLERALRRDVVHRTATAPVPFRSVVPALIIAGLVLISVLSQ